MAKTIVNTKADRHNYFSTPLVVRSLTIDWIIKREDDEEEEKAN